MIQLVRSQIRDHHLPFHKTDVFTRGELVALLEVIIILTPYASRQCYSHTIPGIQVVGNHLGNTPDLHRPSLKKTPRLPINQT